MTALPASIGELAALTVRAEGADWRGLHAVLKAKDPTFGGLERVRDRERYLWVHPQFVPLYRLPQPEIPDGTAP